MSKKNNSIPDHRQLYRHKIMRNKNKYVPVDVVGVVDETKIAPTDEIIPEEQQYPSSNSGDGGDGDKNIIKKCNVLSIAEDGSFELQKGIDYDVVDELVEDIGELRKGLVILLLLFATLAGFISLDDHYNNNSNNTNDKKQIVLIDDTKPRPHMGHKLQLNASAFTVNDFECLQLDTGDWPSERVHCELRPPGDDDDNIVHYDFVVEHFDDEYCQKPNTDHPSVRHTASGCFYFEGYNHSYNDKCHTNRTFTVSAFFGPGCLTPMPVTAVNLLPEDR